MHISRLSTLPLSVLLLGVPALSAVAQLPAGHQPDEVAAVLEVMDRYMVAISDNDLRTMESMQTPDGMTYRARRESDGGWTIQSQPNLYWVAPSRADSRVYRERYWEPTVLVRGAIAMVWAPYEFWIDGRTSHCGVDVFSFVRTEGVWRVANTMWTVEPDACTELRPEDPSKLRPPD